MQDTLVTEDATGGGAGWGLWALVVHEVWVFMQHANVLLNPYLQVPPPLSLSLPYTPHARPCSRRWRQRPCAARGGSRRLKRRDGVTWGCSVWTATTGSRCSGSACTRSLLLSSPPTGLGLARPAPPLCCVCARPLVPASRMERDGGEGRETLSMALCYSHVTANTRSLILLSSVYHTAKIALGLLCSLSPSLSLPPASPAAPPPAATPVLCGRRLRILRQLRGLAGTRGCPWGGTGWRWRLKQRGAMQPRGEGSVVGRVPAVVAQAGHHVAAHRPLAPRLLR